MDTWCCSWIHSSGHHLEWIRRRYVCTYVCEIDLQKLSENSFRSRNKNQRIESQNVVKKNRKLRWLKSTAWYSFFLRNVNSWCIYTKNISIVAIVCFMSIVAAGAAALFPFYYCVVVVCNQRWSKMKRYHQMMITDWCIDFSRLLFLCLSLSRAVFIRISHSICTFSGRQCMDEDNIRTIWRTNNNININELKKIGDPTNQRIG